MIYTSTDLSLKYKNLFQASKALANLAKKGKIIRVSKGIYISKNYTKEDLFEISNMLVQNSYISLETVLSMHGILIEILASNYITAVTTTRRPRVYKTPVGTFEYKYIQPFLFFIPNAIDLTYSRFYMATKEKALIDYLYFKALYTKKEELSTEKHYITFLRELRLDLSNINWVLYKQYCNYLKSHLDTRKGKYNIFKNLLLNLYKHKDKISFY